MIGQIKTASTVLATVSSGGATVLSDTTLVPLGIFTTGCIILTTAAWKISAAIQKQTDNMSRLEDRIARVEARCDTCRDLLIKKER